MKGDRTCAQGGEHRSALGGLLGLPRQKPVRGTEEVRAGAGRCWTSRGWSCGCSSPLRDLRGLWYWDGSREVSLIGAREPAFPSHIPVIASGCPPPIHYPIVCKSMSSLICQIFIHLLETDRWDMDPSIKESHGTGGDGLATANFCGILASSR